MIVSEDTDGDQEDDTISCEVCPKDTYKEAEQYYARDCTSCPVDRPITIGNNSPSIDDCQFGNFRIVLL